MSKAMQLMGSKISLISKSEIRYEGTLFTLNPNESTLALAKVRMFGTENRPTDNPVAARDEVFEFIIFRGQDIKDIRLCEAPLPQPTMPGGLPYDPAIVQHSVPGVGSLGAGLQQPTGLSGSMMRPAFGPMGGMNNYPNLVGDGAAPGGPLGQLGNLMAPGGLGGGLGGLPGGLGLAERAIAAAASELPLSPRGDALHMPPPHPDHFSEGDQGVLSGASARSTNSTPVGGASGSASRKSPVGDGRTKNEDDDHRRTSSRGSGGQQESNRSRQNDSRRDRDRQDRDQHNQQRSGNNGGRSNSRGRSRGGNGGGGQGTGGQNRGGQGQGGQGGGQGSFNRFSNDFRNNRSTKGPLKFDEDYDFESANSKFEELKSKMGKMKIGGDTVLVLSSVPTGEEGKDKTAEAGESVSAVIPADGEAPTDTLVSGGSGANEDGAGKAPDSPVKPVCYDKTRSFFDSISCEAVERSKGNTQRTDWRQERKLNAETFGLPAQRRGGYNRGGRGYGGYGGGRGYGGYGGGRGGQQRDGRDGGYQNNRQDGGYQSGRNAGRQGGGGNYRSGRGGNGNYRDGHGENLGQPRGYHRRNWQQQQQQQQDNRT